MATLETVEEQIDKLKDWLDGKLDDIDEKFDALDAKIENLVVHVACPNCQGTGEVSSPTNDEPGPPYTCPRCLGSGVLNLGNIDSSA